MSKLFVDKKGREKGDLFTGGFVPLFTGREDETLKNSTSNQKLSDAGLKSIPNQDT